MTGPDATGASEGDGMNRARAGGRRADVVARVGAKTTTERSRHVTHLRRGSIQRVEGVCERMGS